MKVSIVAGIYNPPKLQFEHFLDACLNSSLDECEFILVQDNPEDVVSNIILNEYSEKIKNNKNKFVLLSNSKNLGIIPTYNFGLKYATGEYVMFFDTDDFFDIDYLEIMYNYIKDRDLDILIGHSITHFLEDDHSFALNFMTSLNDDVWVDMFKLKVLKDYYIPYVDDPIIMFDSINRVITPKIDSLPLEYSTFYHYIRHDNNISKYSFEEAVESIKDHFKNIQSNLSACNKKIEKIFEYMNKK